MPLAVGRLGLLNFSAAGHPGPMIAERITPPATSSNRRQHATMARRAAFAAERLRRTHPDFQKWRHLPPRLDIAAGRIHRICAWRLIQMNDGRPIFALAEEFYYRKGRFTRKEAAARAALPYLDPLRTGGYTMPDKLNGQSRPFPWTPQQGTSHRERGGRGWNE
jgi:hypothetical protein